MPTAETLRLAVLDASVAVRWVIEEEGSAEAAILLDQNIAWIAPRLLLTEAASALRRKVADGGVAAALAIQALDTLLQAVADGIVRLADDERIVPQALLLAVSLEHKLPDCMYLALAEREGASIATADVRLARLARGRKIGVLLVPSPKIRHPHFRGQIFFLRARGCGACSNRLRVLRLAVSFGSAVKGPWRAC